MALRFAQVDVFSPEPLRGNPVAVVLDADGLDDAAMAAFARWTNLSETTFVLAPTVPGADYRLRIFTPSTELPFAGHPTLGTAHAWLEAQGGSAADRERVVQECGAGLVEVRRRGGVLAFAAPPRIRTGPVDRAEVAEVARGLCIDPGDVVAAEWVDNGPGWMALLLPSADAVLAARPIFDDLRVGIAGPHPPGSEAALEVRAFFGAEGVGFEDPVTGSFNAGLAQWLLESGRISVPYVAAQGTVLGRTGRVHVDQDADGTVWVGGATTTVVRGELVL